MGEKLEIIRDNVISRDIAEEMQESYLNYAMSVIVARALPDVRDGLKPVHRRILIAMDGLKLSHRSQTKKCARIVGEVLGKYHPHGDGSVYDALVRMAQPWSLRYPLVLGQGNFGSQDGDSAAAYRYTEAKMEKISGEMLSDIEKNTVDFIPNFDDTLEEPGVLPAMVPNLLVNGSEGIAVGMATKIPPHNLNEICEGIKCLIKNPDASTEELMHFVTGPDFPTAAFILGKNGIKEAYETGRGKIKIRARANIEVSKSGKENIVITEIPYQMNKADLIVKIARLVRDKKVMDISDLRDESDKDGIRIVISVKRTGVPEIVLNQLYKHTTLQDTYGIILLALVNGQPKVMGLKEILTHFIDFRHNVVVRRTKFELNEAEEKAHILEGLKIALDNIDEVIKIIRASNDPKSANLKLQEAFRLSERQSKAILETRLQKLTSLEVEKVVEELKDLLKIIEKLRGILESKAQRMAIIKNEIQEIQDVYGDERRTEIIDSNIDFSVEDMIVEEDMVVTITHNGYIKRISTSTYRSQRRGGRGLIAARSKEDDFVEHLFIASTHDYILFFTDKGKCYWLKVHEVPQGGRAARGRAVVNMIQVDPDEKVQSFVTVGEFNDTDFIAMATERGLVKKTKLSLYSRPRKGGIFAIDIKDGDRLIDAKITHGDNDIILGTRNGKSIRFGEKDIRATGRKTMGVRGIRLSGKEDRVVGMVIIKREGTVLVVTENGYGKRTKIVNYRTQKRGGKGIITMKTTDKVGKMVTIKEVVDNDDLMIITDKGVLIRQNVAAIRAIGRNTQGVRLIRLDEGAKIAAITRVRDEEEESKNQMEIETD
ncbi:MAG: DNA gyrase subunit A [Candidatus Marinimicrobia bacterium]|nr:DNA gyrase subunit A [Candidatus Neomarinimicrobiota bacterium]